MTDMGIYITAKTVVKVLLELMDDVNRQLQPQQQIRNAPFYVQHRKAD